MLAVSACLWIASCSRSHSEAGDSSTHWLRRCGSDYQCGGLSCVCGVCSTECSATNQCAGLGSAAVCAMAPAAECGVGAASVPRLCDQTCASDQDCGGGASCVDQRCRRQLTSSEPDASSAAPVESDAGSMGTSDGEVLASEAGPTTRDGAVPDAGRAQNTLSFLCPPQRAESSGDSCVQIDGYAWNGAACEPIVCGCVGEDCASVAATRSDCEAKFASCQPSTMCSGLPWYACADNCPAHWVLHGGGRSFGECSGDCSFQLVFDPVIVLDAGSCLRMTANLTIWNTDDAAQRVVNIELTDAAWEEAARLSFALEATDLVPIPPCTGPPCIVDRGQAWFERLSNGTPERFSYEFGAAPEGLRPLDAFIQRLIDQARTCRGDLLARCGSDGPQAGPFCGSGRPVGAIAGCSCFPSVEQLKSWNGTACGNGCGSCAASSTCSATCIQPCAWGDTPVWETSCTE
ncbi:MAG TPA: hypothetical protein VFZ61_15910 [Polyangiales bacterium]